MMNYNYLESMKEDIKDYIKNDAELDANDLLYNRNDLEEKLHDDLWTCDSVTGNASGSYFCNSYKSMECVLDNIDLLHEMCNEFGIEAETIGQKFIDDAAHLKEINPEAYEHEYLGIPNGDGGNVFEYLEIRDITDEEISRMDRIFAGVDYGWYPDAFCYLRTYYDSAREKIYLIDELYVNKWSNSKTADWIKKKGYDDYTMICDSAEPKSVNDFRDAGLPARGAIKGPGSIEYGFKFLQTKTLVIDPKRTPNAYKEITEYEYDRDKEGNVISGYPDGNDHAISALRYAYEPLFNRRGYSA